MPAGRIRRRGHMRPAHSGRGTGADMAAGRRPITCEDRERIEAGLNRGDRLATIARSLGRTQQSVADEIRRNWTPEPRGRLAATTRW